MNLHTPSRRVTSVERQAICRSHRDHETAFGAAMRAVLTRTKGRPAIHDVLALGDQWVADHVRLSASAEVLVQWDFSRPGLRTELS